MAERKSFLIRVDRALLDGVQRWANDNLRSLNAQVEFLLRDAMTRAGRTVKSVDAPADGANDFPETEE